MEKDDQVSSTQRSETDDEEYASPASAQVKEKEDESASSASASSSNEQGEKHYSKLF